MGVNLVLRDIEKDADARYDLKKLSGGTGVPFIDVEGTYVPGYSEAAIRDAVESRR